MATTEVTDETFEQKVLQSSKPVIVDFWAEWCGPCRMLSPVLEQISDQYKDKVEVVTLDVDANPESAATYKISSIPAVILFDQGEVKVVSIGAKPKSALEAEFSKYLT